MSQIPNVSYFIQLVLQPESNYNAYYLRIVNYYKGQEPFASDCDYAWYKADLIDAWNSDDGTVAVYNGQTLNDETNTFQSVVEVSDEVLLNLHEDLIPLPGESMFITKIPCIGLMELYEYYRGELEKELQKELSNNKKFESKDLERILKNVMEEKVKDSSDWIPIPAEHYSEFTDWLCQKKHKELVEQLEKVKTQKANM